MTEEAKKDGALWDAIAQVQQALGTEERRNTFSRVWAALHPHLRDAGLVVVQDVSPFAGGETLRTAVRHRWGELMTFTHLNPGRGQAARCEALCAIFGVCVETEAPPVPQAPQRPPVPSQALPAVMPESDGLGGVEDMPSEADLAFPGFCPTYRQAVAMLRSATFRQRDSYSQIIGKSVKMFTPEERQLLDLELDAAVKRMGQAPPGTR